MNHLPAMSYKLAMVGAARQWELIDQAGRGSTSIVWRARHKQAGRLVALKVANDEPGAAEAVAREAALLARTRRRWGPALVDAGPGYVATEWAEGAPLDPTGS